MTARPQLDERQRETPFVETVTLNGYDIPVVEVPELAERGLTSSTWDGLRIQVRAVGDLEGRVLLHEFLHALLRTDPQRVLVGDQREENFVRMLTAGLHDVLGYRRAAALRASNGAGTT